MSILNADLQAVDAENEIFSRRVEMFFLNKLCLAKKTDDGFISDAEVANKFLELLGDKSELFEELISFEITNLTALSLNCQIILKERCINGLMHQSKQDGADHE